MSKDKENSNYQLKAEPGKYVSNGSPVTIKVTTLLPGVDNSKVIASRPLMIKENSPNIKEG